MRRLGMLLLRRKSGRGSEDDDTIICLGWSDTNREKIYGYTPERYDKIWDIFNEYWYLRNLAEYEASLVR